MRRWRNSLLILLMVVSGVGTAMALPLRDEVQNLITTELIEEPTLAVVIEDANNKAIIYSHNGDVLLIPASNMKLLTTGAALDFLGPEYVFQTRLYRDGDRLTLVGDADPALGDPVLLREMGLGVEDLLAVWVKAVKQTGLTHIAELRIDATILDDVYVHPSWPVDELNQTYSAEVAGVNFHLNALTIFTKPARIGQPPDFTTEPDAPWLHIIPGGVTVKRGANTVWFSRKYMTNEIKIHGKVSKPSQSGAAVTLHNIPEFTGNLLQDRLQQAGIKVDRVVLDEIENPLEPGDLLSIIRTPIATVVKRCNRDSNNLYAESLFKRIGYELTGESGSWATGAAALRQSLLDRLGPSSARIVIDDGSGLSRKNRVTARMLADWLVSFADDKNEFPTYFDSLAKAGKTGTLRERFRGVKLQGKVRAKSGYLQGVSCLSGYVVSPDGERTVVFSILANDIGGKLTVRDVKRFQEKVVAAIDAELAGKPVPAGTD